MYRFSRKSSNVKHLTPNGLSFSVFSEEEMKKMSVVKITTALSFNILGHPYKGGLYDPALGPTSERSDPCGTCSKNVYTCPGHFGHIELPIPTVNPLFRRTIFNILKLACLNCHMLQIKDLMKYVYLTKLKLLNRGYFVESQEVDGIVAEFLTEGAKHMECIIKEKLDEFYQQCLKDKGDEESRDKLANTQTIESQINSILNTMEKSKPDQKMCCNCDFPLRKISVLKKKFMTNMKKSEVGHQSEQTDGNKTVTTLILPEELRTHLRKIWENDKEFILALVPVLRNFSMECPTDGFFISIILVPPPKMRPVRFTGKTMVEHPQSESFKQIINGCILLHIVIKAIQEDGTDNMAVEGKAMLEQMRGKTLLEKLNFAYEELQSSVDFLVDNHQDYMRKQVCPGIKQVIERKSGVIRMHMMGKRVDFAARTVITPDPCLNIQEIGIPEAFATTLTYPVPVTTWNVAELRQMVLNGPLVHPGATVVQNEDGSVIRISSDNPVQRASVAKCLLTPGDINNAFKKVKIVHRHLCTGDVLLMNRQPTLHRPSIMAHVARILKGEKTFRMHYANCKAYNADFDGDEMNAHFPQNELARSEAYNLLNVQKQYLVPKDGTPLSGLIQDHIIGGVRLSVRGRFFDREDYQQLVYEALSYKKKEIKLLPPTILKPRVLWSGKQILSTVIINVIPEGQLPLNLSSKAKISDQAWVKQKPKRWRAGGTPFTDHSMSEAEVIIRGGELLCGVLDKTHYGATPYGLVHCLYEIYGGSCSSNILSSFSKLFNAFLQRDGFTLGIEDILVLDDAEDKRIVHVTDARMIGEIAARHAVDLPETATSDEVKNRMEEIYENKARGRAIVDSSYKEHLDDCTNKINKACIPGGLRKCFPHNNLQLMIQSGAKGSTVNAMQISCLLGQIELEGRRPPHMISGKNLPSFAQYDTTPRAGGFIDGRFMTGIKPQEFFYHCMAGREGLIDTAVKTSRSGYLQRCLVKHLEGLVVRYDATVRDSDGSVIQFCYGEDGKDIMKSQFLKKKQIPFLAENCKAVINVPINELEDSETSELIAQRKKEIRKWKKKHGDPLQKNSRISPFLLFSRNLSSSEQLDVTTKQLCDIWREAESETIERYTHESNRCPDPVAADFQVDRDFGAITEQLDLLMADYLKTRPFGNKKNFRNLMYVKSLQASSQPGEPVGLLAAQSIGEPSTQMTLNTFHFAGRGEMNVTLGIPRLRELLMTASKNIKTPYLDVSFNMDVPNIQKKANRLKLELCRVTVADVLQFIEVTDKLLVQNERQHMYEVHLQFLPRKAYKSKFCVTPSRVLKHVERHFFKYMFSVLMKALHIKSSLVHTEEDSSGKRNQNNNQNESIDADDPDMNLGSKNYDLGEDHESSDEEHENEDDDATLAKSKQRHTENQEYDESDDDVISEDEGIEEDDEERRNKSSRGSSDDSILDEDMEASEEALAKNKSLEKNMTKDEQLTYELRRSKVVSVLPFIQDYDYDVKHELWCKLKFAIPVRYKRVDLTALLKDAVSKSVIWEVPLIKRAITYENAETQNLMLKTEGINFQEIFKFSKLLNLNQIYTNDMQQMAMTYGIEAGRRVLIKEIQNVFKVYGIEVDPRHLLLVADYMTFNGTIKPFSRKSIEDNVSPLQQMSFESSVNFLRLALSRGKRDDLQSPSSRLMLGQPSVGGTGCFSVLYKLPRIKDLGF